MRIKNKTKIFIFAVGFIAFVAGLIYLANSSQAPQPENAANAALKNLIDKPAPLFSLSDREGKIYSTASLKGKNVILFFNEGLICYPACWNQIAALAKDARFASNDTIAFSVVVDSKESWQNAINKMPELGQAIVVFDNDLSVSKEFGALNAASSMHSGKLPGHTYVIIDKKGIVRFVFDDPRMGIRNDELAAEIAKLKN